MKASEGPSHVVFDRLWAPVDPGWLEAPWPFLRRVAARNVVDMQLLESNIRSRKGARDGGAVADAIHELTGVPPTYWVKGHDYASVGASSAGRVFVQQSRSRTGCAKCNPLAESPIYQYAHIRENVCLAHGVWIGPSARVEQQKSVNERAIAAEIRYRNLVATGRVDSDLWEVVWRAVRDSASLCGGDVVADLDLVRRDDSFTPGVDDLRSLYPLIVEVLDAVSGPHLVEVFGHSGAPRERGHQALREALGWFPGQHWIIAGKVESHLRYTESGE